MAGPIQQKIQTAANHVDEVVGYGVAATTGSIPLWAETLTGWLQLVAVIIGIVVGVSTYRLNQVKIKNIKENRDAKSKTVRD